MVDHFAPQASLIGVKLGKYAVQALIGRGAMATVYLAKDSDLGRPVALKVLLGSLARNPEQVRRFQMEALAAAPLQHPNIVRIYDAGTLSGVPFIAMEYVEGESLERFLQRSGALPWPHALHIAQQIADALDCAHRAGIVHRDVKPANILLDRQGRVRLSDFGIANITRYPMTPTGPTEFLGTPEYMSPEQCAGSTDLAPSTDLFSLGVTLYRMLSAQMPFEGTTTVSLIKSIAELNPARLNSLVTQLPDDVARLVAHLLEKQRHQRPPSARAVVDIIARLQRDNGGSSALPEALNSFILEQTQPRRLRTDTPTPHKSSTRGPKFEFVEQKKYYEPISLLARGLAAAMIVVASAGAGYWHFFRSGVPVQAAPTMPGAAFTAAGPGLWKTALPAEHWIATSLHWAGSSSRLLVRCEGVGGTLAQGAAGVLAYDIGDQSSYSIDAPSGPALNADHWQTRPAGAWPGMIPDMPVNAPLAHCFVRPVYGADHAEGQILLVPHPVDAAAPRPEAVFACTPLAWMLPPTGPATAPWAGQAAVSPDGHTLCLLLRDPAAGTLFLAERDVRRVGRESLGRPLAQGGDPIVPGTVQYAPDGQSIAFMRERDPGERSLWIAASGSGDSSATPVALGRLGTETAFSPRGDLIAVNLETDDGPRVVLADTREGAVAAQLGPGRVTQESWHPSGRFLVITADDETTGGPQLIAVSVEPPFARQTLTHLDEGVLLGAAVSRDGHWAAAALASGELAFVDLSPKMFAGTQAGGPA